MHAQEVARRISGTVAGEVYAKVNIPSTHHEPLSPALHYLPFASRFPLAHFTLAVLFALFFLIFSSLFFTCLFACLFALMALPKNTDLHLRRLEEIELNIRSFMTLQFEHSSFFRKEHKEQKSLMEYMNKELDDMSKEFHGLNSQIAHLEKSIAQISDKQATLVIKMAAK